MKPRLKDFNPAIFPVAGIGASAGGLDAFKQLLKAIPENAGIAWILVQHQHPTYESILPELLQKVTPLTVIEITDNIELKPNQVFVMPVNKNLIVKDGKLKLSPRPSRDKIEGHYPINLFFTSIAAVYESNAIGVVLSGSGSDGTKGLKAIKDHGGITIAQDLKSAAYAGMPENAIAAGVVDFILAAENIPAKLLSIKEITGIGATGENLLERDEKFFKEILSLLHIQRGMDFTYYKQTTIRRRILRRMVLNKFKKIADYAAFLQQNKNEVNALYQDMLIPVTSFFRDEKVFNNLCETVFPNLIKNKPEDGIIRIWVAGCSTGEEAYSIAMCFKEYLGDKDEKVQIFATDLSEPAIAKARAGIYGKTDTELVSHGRLKKFFTLSQGNYLINKDLRDMCVFAVHNFLKEPPFSRIDFISCRNVLIYMDTYLQKKALTTFHYALNPHGQLMLGKSENTIGITDLFIASNKTGKIFIRKDVNAKTPPATTRTNESFAMPAKKNLLPETTRTDFQKMADDIILAKYIPAAVVVNAALDIVHFRGNTSLFLEPSAGKPTHNLLKMARPGLAFELRSIVHKAMKEKRAVVKEHITVQLQNQQQFICLEAVPLTGMMEPHWLVIFNDPVKGNGNSTVDNAIAGDKKDEHTLRLQQLEQEILQLREEMRSITEDQEASNEELQSTNEELLSSNEELQSLNEELETSKEELQSTLEELTVVNLEMVNLNEQLAAEKDYAESIIATIPQPMLVLDKDLRVTKANQRFYHKFLLVHQQVEGKLIYEIANGQWDIPALKTLLEEMLPREDSVLGFEMEHDFKQAGHLVIRVNARHAAKDKPDRRILLVIEDVTDYVQAARKVAESEHRYASMIYASPFMIAILEGKDMVIKDANDTTLRSWGLGKEAIGASLYKVKPDVVESGRHKILDRVFETGESYYGNEVPVPTMQDGNIKLLYYTFIYQAQRNIDGKIEGVALLSNEVTPQAVLNKRIKESEEKFQAAVLAVQGIVWTNSATGEMIGEQTPWAALTGQTFEEYQGYGWAQAVHPDDAAPSVAAWQHAVNTRSTFIFEHRVKKKDGNWGSFSVRAIPILNNDRSIREWVGVHTDITEQRNAENEVRESEQRFRTMAESTEILIAVSNETGNATYFNKAWCEFTGRPVHELVEFGWSDLVHPEDRDLLVNNYREAFEKQMLWRHEFRMLNKNGHYNWLLAQGSLRLRNDNVFAGYISSSIDITDRKNMEKALKESAEKTRTIIESAPFPIAIYIGKELRIEFANQSIMDVWGKGNDAAGKLYREVLPELENQQVFEQLESVLETGIAFHAKNQQIDLVVNGKLRSYYFNYSFTPLYDASGNVYGVMNTAADVTDLNLAKQKVEESEAFNRSVLDSSPDCIKLLDEQGRLQFMNGNGICAMEIDDFAHVKDKCWWDMWEEHNQQMIKDAVAKALAGEKVQFQAHSPTMKGQYKWWDVIVLPVFANGQSGKVNSILSVSRDVTSYKEATLKIQENEKRFRLLADSMPQHVWTADAAGNLDYFNQSIYSYSGLSAEQIAEDGWLQVVHPDEREENFRMWLASVNKGMDYHFEHRFRRYDGEYRWQLSRAVPHRDAAGEITMWVGTSTDIQEMKEEEKRKDDFLKMVSHELKTPVTSIKGYVQLLLSILKDETDAPAILAPVKSSLVRIDIQIVRLTRLITEMLDLSRIESGRLELQKKTFSLNELVSETIQDISHTNSTHTIQLEEESYCTVTGDRDRLGQVLINLINNAIKYSPESSVVEIKIFKASENGAAVSVKDFGIGIIKEHQANIFERFYRVSGKNEETFSGFGIGLFIANEIMQRHNGAITVESDKGKGSVFTLIMPLNNEININE
ncbi:MAG: PAS domain-containing protein [Chitinophagaceae bacterium]